MTTEQTIASDAQARSTQSANQHHEQMGGIGDIEDRLDAHTTQMDATDVRMTRIEKKLDVNTEATQEVLEILTLGKAFFKLAGYFGTFVKWSVGIGAPLYAFWYTLKGGK